MLPSVYLLPASGRLAGIDYGARRVGIAVCDASWKYCGPYVVLERHGVEPDRQRILKLVREEGVIGFVVGLPLHTSGEENATTRDARSYAAWLTEITGLPVDFQDERYTSHAAESLLGPLELTKKRRKERLDALAAQIILQSYLDARGAEKLDA
ncbi:MAG TPA: Holliday junction resolvase RuvX [Pirellulaceae bacterium]|nr:Holliday junction resolvase RuvX [Pirellulaceae bacterium]